MQCYNLGSSHNMVRKVHFPERAYDVDQLSFTYFRNPSRRGHTFPNHLSQLVISDYREIIGIQTSSDLIITAC